MHCPFPQLFAYAFIKHLDLTHISSYHHCIFHFSPTELGLCEKLEMLRIHGTNIEGKMPVEICMLRDKSLNSAKAGALYADCRPNNRTGEPFLICDCCSDCCDHTTGVCIADD
jgi:hypothetical protein